ncbi:alpha-amylase [Brotaphodocola sp.]|uniref:alpha-amylase n=1 Tax=Brotaphodocola sp. TaxID=3073577 RepID=UPI003D7DD1DE
MHSFKIDSSARGDTVLGLTRIDGGIRVAVAVDAEECALLLYLPGSHTRQKEEKREAVRIPFPREGRTGNVWAMTVLGEDLDRYDYVFEADGVRFEDPHGRAFKGHERWGKKELGDLLLRTPVSLPEFDWEDDKRPEISYEDMIVYRLHVRGFTRHASSGVEDRGTFMGIAEKIPYLRELGVTTVELMPSTEFNEVMMRPVQIPCRYQESKKSNPAVMEADGRLNYWGYGPSFLFAPKASYAGKGRNPVTEFKTLVKTLHREKLGIVTELFFTGEEAPADVLEVARFWVREFHVDGLHISGTAPIALLASDPYLADTMIWATSWDGVEIAGSGPKKDAKTDPFLRRLAESRIMKQRLADAGISQEKTERIERRRRTRLLGECNDGFLVDMRRVLKGDEGQMGALAFRSRRNPETFGVLNYMASNNGFTMADMVSYDQKHNEANGEENRDGTDYNCSWNCGAEGPVRRKKIRQLRKKQLRNAVLLLMLSQGTPLLLAGDEFGNSQDGNNNAYCQDNEISWLNWNNQKTNADQLEFVKRAIAFRKEHPVFHQPTEPKLMDSLACGQPDVSYHGVSAWKPEFDGFRRQFGILYCGEYAKKPDGKPDDPFFVIYNMHWEPHEFALPTLSAGKKWHVVFQTADEAQNGFYEAGKEPELKSQKKFMAPSRSIAVFIGKTVEKP